MEHSPLLALFCSLSAAALAQQGAGGDIPAGPQDPFKAKTGSKTNRACTRKPEAATKKKIVVEIQKSWLDDGELFQRNVSALISLHKISEVDWKITGMEHKGAQLIKHIAYLGHTDAAYAQIVIYEDRFGIMGTALLFSQTEYNKSVKAFRQSLGKQLNASPNDARVIDKFCRENAFVSRYTEFREYIFDSLSEGLPPDGRGISRYKDERIKEIETLPSPEAKHIAKLLRDGLPDHPQRADRIRFVATIRIPKTPPPPPESRALPGFEKKVAEWQRQVNEIKIKLRALQTFGRDHWLEVKQRAAVRAEREQKLR